MQDNRDQYEPIIATRRPRDRLREDTPPLWRLVLALGAGLAAVVVLVFWWMGRSSSDGEPTIAKTDGSLPEARVEQAVEQTVELAPAPPAKDSEPQADLAQAPAPSDEPAVSPEQAAAPESIPKVVPDDAYQAPLPTTPVRFTSLDLQVQFEVRGPLDSSPKPTIKAGEVVTLAPGTYRVVASGSELETFEQDITIDGERPLEYTVALCVQSKQELETLTGQVVEERVCASTVQCETMFTVLSEHADQLVKDPAFRTQRCAKWRPEAVPDGSWTLDTKCDGATLATTCRIEIAQGACTLAQPRRTVRGEACPRAEIKER